MTKPRRRLLPRAGHSALAGLVLALALVPSATAQNGYAQGPCAEVALPAWPPPGAVPDEPPPEQPPSRPGNYDPYLFTGQIRPLEQEGRTQPWYRLVRLPLHERPGGAPWGWIFDGWVIDLRPPQPFATPLDVRVVKDDRSMRVFQDGKAPRTVVRWVFRFVVHGETEDGWLEVRWGRQTECYGGLAWVDSCVLRRLDPPLRYHGPGDQKDLIFSLRGPNRYWQVGGSALQAAWPAFKEGVGCPDVTPVL